MFVRDRPAPAFEPVSELFFKYLLENMVGMGQFGIHALVLAQFGLKLLEPFELIRLHPGILASPCVERGLADSVLTAQVCGLAPFLMFGQNG